MALWDLMGELVKIEYFRTKQVVNTLHFSVMGKQLYYDILRNEFFKYLRP